MTSPDDLELRRRSIFDRLRAEVEGEADGSDASDARVDVAAPSEEEQPDRAAVPADGPEAKAPDPGETVEPEAVAALSESAGDNDGAGSEVEALPEETHGDANARVGGPSPAEPAADGAVHEVPSPGWAGATGPEAWDDGPAAAVAEAPGAELAGGEPAGDAVPHTDETATSDASASEARDGDAGTPGVEPVAPAAAAVDLNEPADATPLAPDAATPAAAPDVPARPALPRIFAVANQKGGVGKTTTAVNLSAGLAELGYRVLVIDLDPQGNATTGLGINARNLDVSIYDVLLHDTPMEDTIEPSSLRNLFVVPATIDLAGAEIELVPAFSRELRLRKALDTVLDDFDYVFIDCPPSLGLLTVNGLAAATEVLVPIQCEYYALEGLGQLLRNVNLVQANLNPTLELSTIVLTMFDARTKLAEQVVGDVRSHFGAKVCRNVVPRTVRLSEAPSFGQPITLFDPTSRGAIAYRELAKEVSGGPAERLG